MVGRCRYSVIVVRGFSRDEVEFAKKIFYPYVNEELSDEGIATGEITRFEYREWLLRFVISLHWRLISVPEDRSYLPQNLFDLLCTTKDIWRDFLLSKRNYTGENQTHLFFLQNIAVYLGYIPNYINDRVNFYVLRAVDFTPILSESGKFGIYSKIGPIAFYTSLKPKLLKNTPDSRLGMNGKLRTIQILRNTSMNRFIFVDRPNQIFPKLEFSEPQQEVIRKAYMTNKQRVANSKTMRAHEADIIMRKLKELQESTDEFHL